MSVLFREGDSRRRVGAAGVIRVSAPAGPAGVGLGEIILTGLILKTGIYCGVPDANAAFRIAQRTLEGMD